MVGCGCVGGGGGVCGGVGVEVRVCGGVGGCVCVCQWLSSVQLFVTPKVCTPPDSSVYIILQARILE